MRGVSLRGRRLPANRSAGPARPPVVPAAVPRRSRRGHAVSGFAAARGTVPGGPYSLRAPPAGVLLPAIAPLMRAPPAGPGLPASTQPGGTRQRTGTTTTARHRPAADDPHRQPMPPPAFRRVCRPPRSLAGQPALHLPAPRHLRRHGPGRGQSLPGTPSAHPAPGPIVPRKPASRVPRGSCPGAASSPVRPLSAAASAGPWPLLSRTRSGAGLAGQHLAGTGYGPDLCPYRQPGATSCRACRMFPIACYGLTPRCREVKR
jgi:hypothetical protein